MTLLVGQGRSRAQERSDAAKMRGARLVVLGPLIAVAFGKWGSYLGIPGTPVYFSDLAVAAGMALLLIGHFREPYSRRDGHSAMPAMPATPVVLVGASCCVAAVILLGAVRSAGVTLYTVRDAVPFVYLMLIPILRIAVATLGPSTALRWLRTAAIVHTIWFAPAIWGLLPEFTLPLFGGAPIFSLREDFDVLICGLTIAMVGLDRSLSGAGRTLLLLVSAAAAFSSGSRAGLISAVAIVLCVAAAERPFADPRRGKARLAVTHILVIPVPLIAVYLLTDPPAWAAGLQKLVPNSSSSYTSGQNTWGARETAWRLVVDRLSAQVDTTWGGFGFGSNFIMDSGALPYLSGDPNVRAAHNFAVTWLAMVGIVGLALLLAAFCVWFGLAFQSVHRRLEGASTGFALMSGVVLAASAGVILESPFGYMTFALATAIACGGVSATTSRKHVLAHES